ncbi:MAG TPA: hypothetical protein VHW90_02495 [Stellaceae bacterium]|jgi:hypothetical protein|nr:hypothetical protein [Stellaceae bacterium]
MQRIDGSAAIVLAGLFSLWLSGCSLLTEAPATATDSNAPITAEAVPAPEPASGPVALAPEMTGPPATSRPAATAAAMPQAPAPTVSVAAAAAPAPRPCPSGTIGMWSEPDLAGAAVFVCHQIPPRR